ncbi:hypothetical protein ACT3CD_01320 [Geofilum sp. OHC36d9]|uniref:hypothetical protein n=1 Tax=Geofilum sp. OHC36d9 TaxID=3458413 RepID=UPI004033316E
MNLLRKLLAFIIGLFIFCSPALGQEDNKNQFKYCIAIKQTFESWGNCNHGKPQFVKANLKLETSGNNLVSEEKIASEDLGVIIAFSETFKRSSDSNIDLPNLEYDNKALEGVVINTEAKDIRVDTKLSYTATSETWRVGVNEPVSGSASDPCSWLNLSGNREGYTMFTTVIIDDPVMINSLRQEPFDAESEYLQLEFNNFYLSAEHQDVVLQMKVNYGKHEWEDLKEFNIRPGKKAYISYFDIAGNKSDSNSNYYTWLDKPIKFRIKKVLLNDSITYGNTVEATFNSNGPQFRVKEVRRIWCVDEPIIEVEFLDQMEIAAIDDAAIKWELRGPIAEAVPCVGKKVSGNTYRIEPESSTPTSPFTTAGTWTIQLQMTSRSDLKFATETFVIPEVLEKVEAQQSAALFPASEPKYHLLSEEDPYAIINISDSDNRLPYVIDKVVGEDTLFVDSLHVQPSNFSLLSENEQDAIYQNFVNRYYYMEKGKRNTNWEKYFYLRFNDWFFENKRPVKTTIANKTNFGNCSSSFSFEYLFVMSDNANFLGSAYFYNLTNSRPTGFIIKLTYESQQMAEQYHSFWKNFARSDEFSFDEGTASSGSNSFNPGTWLRIDNAGLCEAKYHTYSYTSVSTGVPVNYQLVNYNGCSIVGKDNSDNFHLVGTLGDAFGLKVDLPDYFDGIIDDTGTKCAYRNEDGSKLFYYERGTGGVRFWSGALIKNIRYINTTSFPNYIVYETASGDRYQQFLIDESNKQDVADRFFSTESLYIDWYDDYLEEQWQLFLSNNYGYRLYNHTSINPPKAETYILTDKDGCSYEFFIEVKVPEQPDFEIIQKTNPSSNCSSDGIATLKCTKGSLPLSYTSGIITSLDTPFTIEGLSWSDTIEFYNSETSLTYAFPVYFEDNASGIQKITTAPQTCESAPDGSITVHFATNSTGSKTYKLKNLQGELKREIITDSNVWTFPDLEGDLSYQVFVEVDGCTLGGDSVIVVENEVFTMRVDETNADEIGGLGNAKITLSNLPTNPTWIGEAFTEDITTKDYSVGSYTIKALDEGCVTQYTFDILEPGFSGSIEVLKDDEGFKLDVSDLVFNDLIRDGHFEIKDVGGEEYAFNQSLSDGKVYVINLIYDGKIKEVYRFSNALFNTSSLAHSIELSQQVCPDDEVQVKIVPESTESDFKVNFDGLFLDDLETSTNQATLEYMVQTSESQIIKIATSQLNVNKVLQANRSVEIPHTQVVSGRVSFADISCHGLNNGQISILNPSGGSGSYAWRLGNSDVWMDTAQVAENLQPGNYDVYIKDDVNNCPEVNVGSVTLEEPDEMVVADSSWVAPVCSDGKGSVSMSVSGGNEWYSFVLKNDSTELDAYPMEEFTDETSVTFDSLVAGEYILTATDPMGCAVDAQFVMEPYDNPVIDGILVEPVVCNGESNGSMEVLNTTGTADPDSLFLFDLNTHELGRLKCPDQKFEALSAGTYRLLLHDVNGCVSDTVQRVVYQPDSLRLEIDTIRSVIGKGTDSGYILSRVTGGNTAQAMTALLTPLNGSSPTVRQLSVSEQIPFVFTSLKAGAYQVEVNDYKACSVTSAPIEVFEPDEALRVEVIDVQNALCKAAIGSFTIQGAGGWGDYVYRRATDNGLAPIKTFNRLSAGSYKVFVEDALGASADTTIVITEPDLLTVEEAGVVLPTCNDNGVLEVAVDGGMYPYNLVFKGDADTTRMTIPGRYSFSNRSVGGYRLAAIDNNGCRAVVESSLSDSLLLSIQDIESGVPSKPGSTDGWMRVKVKGGREPLFYEWRCLTENATILTADSATVLNIPSGYYQVTVQEAGGCTVSRKQYLHDVSDGLLSITAIGHETSWQANDGYASFSSAVLDITRVEVYYPNNAVVQYAGNEDSGNFNIDEATFSLTNLTGGEYLVFAYSDAGVEVAEFEIDTYEAFKFGNIEVQDVAARGDASGVINVTVEGGVPDYDFRWEALDGGSLENAGSVNYFNESIVEGVPAGSYRVAVTDIYDNLIETVVDVAEPSARLNIVVSDITNQSCRDSVDAYVEVEASGGWGDYQFSYADKDNYQDLNRWDALPVGRHWVYTIDKNGGADSIFVIIAEPPYLRASQVLVDSAKCYNDASGKVLFDIEGGTGPYRFALVDDPLVWKSTTEMVDAGDGLRDYFVDDRLPEGHRVYRFTDANNCHSLDTLAVYIPQPDELLLSFTDVVHTTCNTDNGSIEVGLKGGTLPYRYEWIDNSGTVISTAPSVSDLRQHGFYSLDVWDKYNCHLQFEQTIKPSTRPVITDVETNPVLCYGDSNGSASITGVVAAEPYAPYRFYWSDGQTGDSVSGLAAGSYYVTIRDTNLCETTNFFDINTPDTLGLSLLQLRNAHCFGYNDGFIEVKPLGGVENYRYLWSNGDTTNRAVDLVKGDYHLIFTDGNKCAFEQSFFVDEPPMATVNIGDDFTMCPGNSVVIDGRDFASHQWQCNGDIVSDERYITVSDEGNYFLRVTNDIGCFAYDTITVAIGNDALQADFLMTAEAFIGDTLMLFELSNLPLDSLSWSFQSTAFVNATPVGVDDYILHLKTLQEGMFNVSLYAYSGGCFSKRMKQVEVQNGEYDMDGDDLLGYSDPLIESFIVSPNPSSGLFNVKVTLREEAEIQLSVFSISEGAKLEERTRSGLKVYAEPFVLTNVNTGVYVVILTAGNERRQVKIVIE